MTKRAAELAEVGQRALCASTDDGAVQSEALVNAFASMLDAAIPAKRKPPAPKSLTPELPFTPRDVHMAFVQRCSELVVCFPVDGRAFAQLGAGMKSIEGLEAADLERLTGWVEAGGLHWWKGLPAFQNVVNNFGKWVSLAREWDKRGRQSLRGDSNVGKPVQDDVGSRFR